MNNTNVTSPKDVISNALLMTPFQLNIYLGLFIFVTGNISSIGNFFVFSSRTFRVRACSMYLIAESMFTFIYFNYVLVTRIIQKGFQFPIINRYDVVCKIRQFLSEYTHQVAFTLFTLATIDRLLSTQRSMGHRLVLYSTSTGICRSQPGIYDKYDSYFEAIMSGVVPPAVLMILGSFLLRNVRAVARRLTEVSGIAPHITNTNITYIQQIDAQITTMILLQSFVAVPSFLPYGAQNLYSSITEDWYKSPLRIAWENVFIETIRLFSYLFYSTSFYVSFLSSRGFRKQVLQALGIKRQERRVLSLNINT